MKTNLKESFNHKLNKTIGSGSITDGIYKLEIRVTNYSEVDYYSMDIQKGNKVEVIGVIENNGKYI